MGLPKMLPRNFGESREDWVTRNEAYAGSPEGQEAGRREEEAASASERLQQEQALLDNQVPKKFVDLIFHAPTDRPWRQTPALAAAGVSRESIVVLVGGPGTGKTAAAAWWLLGLEDGAGLFVRASKLARWERYSMEQMDLLLAPQRLVIDDLGNEFMDAKGSYLSTLEEVVIDRYENGRRTLITTNVVKADFLKRYEGRIADRMNESGVFFGVGAESMRGPA